MPASLMPTAPSRLAAGWGFLLCTKRPFVNDKRFCRAQFDNYVSQP